MNIETNRSSSVAFFQGDAVSARKLNDLALSAKVGHTTHSDGAETMQGGFGTVFMSQASTPQLQYQSFPFMVTYGYNDNSTAVRVYVRPGTVNNRIPKIGTKYLDDKDPPYLEFSTFPAGGGKVIAIRATKAGVKFFPNIIDMVVEDSVPDDTDNNGYLVIATLSGSVVSGLPLVTAVNQTTYSSQVVVRAKPGTATAVWSWTSR